MGIREEELKGNRSLTGQMFELKRQAERARKTGRERRMAVRFMRKECDQRGLKLVTVEADGNCFPRTVAKYLWGDEGMHRRARAAISIRMQQGVAEQESWAGCFTMQEALHALRDRTWMGIEHAKAVGKFYGIKVTLLDIGAAMRDETWVFEMENEPGDWVRDDERRDLVVMFHEDHFWLADQEWGQMAGPYDGAADVDGGGAAQSGPEHFKLLAAHHLDKIHLNELAKEEAKRFDQETTKEEAKRFDQEATGTMVADLKRDTDVGAAQCDGTACEEGIHSGTEDETDGGAALYSDAADGIDGGAALYGGAADGIDGGAARCSGAAAVGKHRQRTGGRRRKKREKGRYVVWWMSIGTRYRTPGSTCMLVELGETAGGMLFVKDWGRARQSRQQKHDHGWRNGKQQKIDERPTSRIMMQGAPMQGGTRDGVRHADQGQGQGSDDESGDETRPLQGQEGWDQGSDRMQRIVRCTCGSDDGDSLCQVWIQIGDQEDRLRARCGQCGHDSECGCQCDRCTRRREERENPDVWARLRNGTGAALDTESETPLRFEDGLVLGRIGLELLHMMPPGTGGQSEAWSGGGIRDHARDQADGWLQDERWRSPTSRIAQWVHYAVGAAKWLEMVADLSSRGAGEGMVQVLREVAEQNGSTDIDIMNIVEIGAMMGISREQFARRCMEHADLLGDEAGDEPTMHQQSAELMWRRKLQEVEVVHDGNDLFRAIAETVGWGQDEHLWVRAQIVGTMGEIGMMDAPGQDMTVEGTPGYDDILFAASLTFGMKFEIVVMERRGVQGISDDEVLLAIPCNRELADVYTIVARKGKYNATEKEKRMEIIYKGYKVALTMTDKG
jgi:hypothetical protein